jgi:kumamolisin
MKRPLTIAMRSERPPYVRVLLCTFLIAILTATAFLVFDHRAPRPPAQSGLISGPLAWLLTSSTDLGPSRVALARLTVELRQPERPVELTEWAGKRGLTLRWRDGDPWASLEGQPARISTAFDVQLHDYRGRSGQIFYASPQQPEIPPELGHEVAGLGRLLSYTPAKEAKPPSPPRDVPDQGLNPEAVLRTYQAESLRRDGFTGKGITIIIFAFDGFDQGDLDMFSTTFGLPKFTPDIVGGMPSVRRSEATMDLQVAHGIAPDARKVLYNARYTAEGDNAYQRIAEMMEDADRRYPGAVWSFSIGWGCDKLITAADLAPARAALAAAQKHGTTAFNASGDMAGLECKGGQAWSTPPGADEAGLDAVASLPEMTNVGGTTLSTDANGNWLAEQAWFDPALSLGTGGGESAIFERPPWQGRTNVPRRGTGMRQTPDISAVSDPFTGIKFILNRQVLVGGGTSMAAPLWAGLAAVMNQYLIEHGGRLLGNLNPLLYGVAAGSQLPAFRDVILGGNAVESAHPGYDLVTGLGTPNVENLVRNLLVAPRLFD